MATIDDFGVVQRIINGEFNEDGAFKISRYTNAWGGTAYGVCFIGDQKDKYRAAPPYVNDPEVIWEISEAEALARQLKAEGFGEDE